MMDASMFRVWLLSLTALMAMGTFRVFGQHWVQTAGPEGMRVSAIWANANGELLAASPHKGVFRSSDFGNSWNYLGLNGHFIISFGRNDSGILFAGTWDRGVLRSTDSGVTWLDDGLGTSRILSIVSLKGDSLMASGSTGYSNATLFLSSDGGRHWNTSALQHLPYSSQSMAYDGKSAVFVISGGRILRSADFSQAWDTLHVAGNSSFSMITVSDKGTVFVASNYYDSLYLSLDSGENWTTLRTPPGEYCRNVAIGQNNTLFVTTSLGLFRSEDYGESWKICVPGIIPTSIRILESGTMVSGTETGVFISTDGGENWRNMSSGITLTSIILLQEIRGSIWAGVNGGSCDAWCTTQRDIFFSSDRSQSWRRSSGWNQLSQYPVALTTFRDSTLYFFTATGIHTSDDWGNCWSAMDTTFNSSCGRIVDAHCTSNGVLFIVTTCPGYRSAPSVSHVLRSVDGGRSWMGVKTFYNYSLTITSDESGVIFIGTDGYIRRGVYRSGDDGTTWEQVGLYHTNVLALVAVRDSGILFASTNDGMYRSSNSGYDWTRISDLAPELLCMHRDGKRMAATNGGWNDSSGVWMSTDGGANWDTMNTGLPTKRITSLLYGSDGYLYAGTGDMGVFRTAPIQTHVELGADRIPQEARLYQNFPAPFNPRTVIEYELPTSSFVRLSVHNLLGEEIAVLVDDRKEAGRHRVDFDGSNRPSGVYLYTLKVGTNVLRKKMVLVR